MRSCVSNYFLITILFFLSTVSIAAIDKVVAFLFFIFLLKKKYAFVVKYFLLLFVVPCLSFVLNIPHSSLKVFFLPIFVSVAIGIYICRVSLICISKALDYSILLGIIFALLANLGISQLFSFSLVEKGLPELFAPMGMSPTQQVYGTLCIINLIINFEEKRYGWSFYLSLLGILMTVNRCSILFCLVLFLLYKRTVFYIICVFVCLFFFYFFDEINEILFSLSTLESRNELRKGVEFSFWKSNDLLTYLVGTGTIETLSIIAQKTEWGRVNIENGLDFLLHSYGFVGLLCYSFFSIILCYWLCKKKVYHLVPIVIYYLFVEQWFTQEFVASSFMLFLATILLLSDLPFLVNKKRILLKL